MSSKESKFTTPKKSYSEVVTPSKKERNNPFLLLSKETKYYTIHSYLSPAKDISMGKSTRPKDDPDDPDNIPSGPGGDNKGTNQTQEPNLHEILEELIPSIGTSTAKNPHEIIKGLSKSGITT